MPNPKMTNRGPAGLLRKTKDGRPGKIVNRGGAGLLAKAKGDGKEAFPFGANASPAAAEPQVPEGRKNHINSDLKSFVVDIAKLNPDPMNARLHPERNIQAVKDSLSLYGQRSLLVVRREGMVVAKGNGTLEAAKQLGWTRIAASVQSMTDVEFHGYALADNRSAELARWDLEVVARVEKICEEQKHPLIGWTPEEVVALRMQDSSTQQDDPDKIPEAPKTPVTKAGDLWIMGPHRLFCGDCAIASNVKKLMDGKKGSLMATDPPYGVEFGKANHNPRAKEWNAIKGDDRQGSELRKWFANVLKIWIPSIKDDSAFYIWSAPLSEGHRFYEAIIDAGLHVQGQIVWVKNVFALGQADYQWCHEPCWYAFWKGKHHRWFGGRDKRTTWEISKLPNAAYLHPMQKPVELYERPIEYNTTPGDIVVEPFAGSGTQFIAAQRLQRVCYGMDIDPVYCDVTLQRWTDFTGQDPVRKSDGVKWSRIKSKG